MPSYGPRSPTAQTQASQGSDVIWVNPGNVFASDNVYATCATGVLGFSFLIIPTGYGFTIPAGEAIATVVIEVEGNYTAGTGVQWWISMVSTGFDPLEFSPVAMPGAEAYAGVTKSVAAFSTMPTRAQVNDAGFGVKVYGETVSGAADVIRIDHIRITVTTTSGNPNGARKGLLRIGY